MMETQEQKKKAQALIPKAVEFIEGATGFVAIETQILEYVIQSELDKALADINHTELPTELETYIVRRACGMFIHMNAKEILGSDGAQVAKSIRMGDTSIDLGGTTDEDRLRVLIEELTQEDRRLLACYRRIRW
nr:MAG TPA: tail connector protein [Caudoviricetes sp.]